MRGKENYWKIIGENSFIEMIYYFKIILYFGPRIEDEQLKNAL